MFWRMAGLSTISPVESLLDKDSFTLEELLDEDDLIQECKSLNTRLINFLRGKVQIQQLLKYIVEEPPEGSDNKRVFKFPFISCEIFTCEIEIILKTIVEDEELIGLLFSFLDPERSHGPLLAGYFSKVAICLLMRKTASVMRYLQTHQEILWKLVDLISITSIMEVLIRIIGTDDAMHAFHEDSFNWLADTNLLDMLLDKLSPPNSSEAHANAADTLSAVSRLSLSELKSKLSSPSFIARLLNRALEDQDSKSTLVHSLTVCIALLDPKRPMMVGMGRGQQISDSLQTAASAETIDGMLQRLGDLLKVLDVEGDGKLLHTTYGELCPPLGIHRLKIIEFVAVLLRTNSDAARQGLVRLCAIQQALKLFFNYPFNNFLHHHVENIIATCIESGSKILIDHLLVDCDLVARLLGVFENPFVLSMDSKPTVAKAGKHPPKVGNLGHLTRIANRLVHASSVNSEIQAHLQEKPEWLQWQVVLQRLNSTENVSQWTCGRPNTLRERSVNSDEDDYQDRDYEISSHISREVLGYQMQQNEDEELGVFGRGEDDGYFEHDSSGVVMSSLRLGEEQDLHSNVVPSPNGRNIDDNEVASSDEDLVDTASSSNTFFSVHLEENFATTSEAANGSDMETSVYNFSASIDKFDTSAYYKDENIATDSLSVRSPEWTSWQEPTISFSDNNTLKDAARGEFVVETTTSQMLTMVNEDVQMTTISDEFNVKPDNNVEIEKTSQQTAEALFDEKIHCAQVEIEGKAIDHALHEGNNGESGPNSPTNSLSLQELEDRENCEATTGDTNFTDVNYWRTNYDDSKAEVESL